MSGSTTTPDRWTDLLARRDGGRAASLAQYGRPGRFDADRALSFFNRPFAAMTGIEPEWLAERPEGGGTLMRLRLNGRPQA